MEIKFNKPFICDISLKYINEAINSGNHSGNGKFSKKCANIIKELTNSKKVFITPSCTASLEISALLLGVKQGDEIIMPSYTFVSTANAFVLRGAKPIFVDIRQDTLNINENCIENAISAKTKAIIVVHYAGVSCNMNKIKKISLKYKIPIIEDAAQGYLSKFDNNFLGSIGDIGCFSFHETKNIACGEGGALLINNKEYLSRANLIINKGTNVDDFKKGLVDKYEWIDIGSSFLISEITSAYLLGQLESSKLITAKRKNIWEFYDSNLRDSLISYKIQFPLIPENCSQNYHIYYLILEKESIREEFIKKMINFGITCTSHYSPLHSSKFANKLENNYILPVTENLSKRIVRLPLYASLKKVEVQYIVSKVIETLKMIYS